MCGISAYIGFGNNVKRVIDSLKRLEYRGYDSAGIAYYNDSLYIKKVVGAISNKENFFLKDESQIAIGHTRWATHGKVSLKNAHPHNDCNKRIAVVHNGIIENFLEIKNYLLSKGHNLYSETDTELIAHLIEEFGYGFDSFKRALQMLKGSFALVVIDKDKLYFARKDSPLILGIADDFFSLASDLSAFSSIKEYIVLNDYDYGFIDRKGYKIYNLKGQAKITKNSFAYFDNTGSLKGFKHYMQKEIYEQEFSLKNTMLSDVSALKFSKNDKIHFIASGTSYHSTLLFKYLLNKKGYNADAYIASEYCYIANPDSAKIVAVSQSGETADVLKAVKYAKKNAKEIIAVTNVPYSSLARISEKVVNINAGPEISVAATKTFSSQLALFYKSIFGAFDLSEVFSNFKEKEKSIEHLAEHLKNSKKVFFLARSFNYPIALEASLKFKEITYIASEAYPAGELKHGPLALIDSDADVIFFFSKKDKSYEKIKGNVEEVKARSANIAIFSDDLSMQSKADYFIKTKSFRYSPFVFVPYLQLLAYKVSVSKGINPDRPRNLAKSVTVE